MCDFLSRSDSLLTAHGKMTFPVFMPDGTYGYVRSVSAADLRQIGMPALMMNSFHLMQKPGSSTIQSLGGLHNMADWRGPLFTDSGGFQAYSLIRQNSKFGRMDDRGIMFTPEGGSRKFQLTPEKSVQLQLAYGSDVLFCLDDCTHADAPRAEQELSVQRTIQWARRARKEFDKLAASKGGEKPAPKLFAVIQGGRELDLRRQCAEELLAIGFDGFGFGGWPLDGEGQLLEDILHFVRSLVPPEYCIHALGIGHPRNVAAGYQAGYDLFDCAMPTRDARHGRLYAFTNLTFEAGWLDYLYIQDEGYIKSNRPLWDGCDCPLCIDHSAGYLRHLFKMNDPLYARFATLHNLRFMVRLTDLLREQAHART